MLPFLSLAAAVASVASAEETVAQTPLWMYVGTYTRNESKGIYLYEMDRTSGKLTEHGLVAEVESPSFLVPHPERDFLYSVGEGGSFEGKPGGAVSAFSLDPATGKLHLLNQEASGGGGPCFISLDPAGKFAFVANYGGGSVSAFPIVKDGSLGERSAFQQHAGSGSDPKRQKGPHAHSIYVDPSGRFALAADLGINQIRIYRVTESGGLEANEPAFASLAPGAGPRHLAFHPDGRVVYVINELDSTLTVFQFDPETGAMAETQTLPTVPEGFSGKNHPAEVLMHPSGKFLYGSNRGHDSLVIYSVGEDGKVEIIDHQKTGGKNPRSFGIEPGGRFLVVAHQDSNDLISFRIDTDSGKLTPTGETHSLSLPVCVRFR